MPSAESANRKPQVGDVVQYSDGEGRVMPAIVTITPDTYDIKLAGALGPAPGPDEVSLVVIRPSGRTEPQHKVPREGSEAYATALSALIKALDPTGDPDEPDAPPLLCWQFIPS